MLTSEQLNAVHHNSDFLIVEGDFGTGKTYVLKERVKMKSKGFTNSKIAYINLTSLHNSTLHYLTHNGSMSLMDILATNDFEEYGNVVIVTVSKLYEHIIKNSSNITLHGEENNVI